MKRIRKWAYTLWRRVRGDDKVRARRSAGQRFKQRKDPFVTELRKHGIKQRKGTL